MDLQFIVSAWALAIVYNSIEKMKSLRQIARQSVNQQSIFLRASLFYVKNHCAEDEIRITLEICTTLPNLLDSELGLVMKNLSNVQASCERELLGVHKIYCGHSFDEFTMSDVD
jgi:hypothetical protein